ncbi:hypothetical protein EAG_07478 [Camponotus floridanus]|uniref:Uncharacterized protein n=1 Tax=Camponotus floridanus TaxID=104421 RepID=E2A8Y4_CAMFO|nr:hypothetical protein EAG_07478 [Camponotus floridanus]
MRGPRPGLPRMMPRRMWKRKRGADDDQSAASVPPESVSPLAAPFAGSCGLSPVDLLYREASIVARATASQVAPEDQSRYVPRRSRQQPYKLDASSSGALCEASLSLSPSVYRR